MRVFEGYCEFDFGGETWEIVETNGGWGVDGLGWFLCLDAAVEAIKDHVREVEDALARQRWEEYRDWCRSGKD